MNRIVLDRPIDARPESHQAIFENEKFTISERTADNFHGMFKEKLSYLNDKQHT